MYVSQKDQCREVDACLSLVYGYALTQPCQRRACSTALADNPRCSSSPKHIVTKEIARGISDIDMKRESHDGRDVVFVVFGCRLV